MWIEPSWKAGDEIYIAGYPDAGSFGIKQGKIERKTTAPSLLCPYLTFRKHLKQFRSLII